MMRTAILLALPVAVALVSGALAQTLRDPVEVATAQGACAGTGVASAQYETGNASIRVVCKAGGLTGGLSPGAAAAAAVVVLAVVALGSGGDSTNGTNGTN